MIYFQISCSGKETKCIFETWSLKAPSTLKSCFRSNRFYHSRKNPVSERTQNHVPSTNFNVLSIQIRFQSHMQFNSTMEQWEFISYYYLSSETAIHTPKLQRCGFWTEWYHIQAVNRRASPPLLQEKENTAHEWPFSGHPSYMQCMFLAVLKDWPHSKPLAGINTKTFFILKQFISGKETEEWCAILWS